MIKPIRIKATGVAEPETEKGTELEASTFDRCLGALKAVGRETCSGHLGAYSLPRLISSHLFLSLAMLGAVVISSDACRTLDLSEYAGTYACLCLWSVVATTLRNVLALVIS